MRKQNTAALKICLYKPVYKKPATENLLSTVAPKRLENIITASHINFCLYILLKRYKPLQNQCPQSAKQSQKLIKRFAEKNMIKSFCQKLQW